MDEKLAERSCSAPTEFFLLVSPQATAGNKYEMQVRNAGKVTDVTKDGWVAQHVWCWFNAMWR